MWNCNGQPQVRGAQPAFSFRQFLWKFKMLPFGCRGEKWLFLVRKRQFPVMPTDLSGEEYQQLVHQLQLPRKAAAEQQRMIDRDVERTFQQLQTALSNPKRSNFLVKSPYSATEFLSWKASTLQLLSVFLVLKPQIGYCQVDCSVVRFDKLIFPVSNAQCSSWLLVQESKMNSEIAFRLFLALTEKFKLDNLYGPDMKDVNLRYFQVNQSRIAAFRVYEPSFYVGSFSLWYQLDEALRLHLPRLHAHLSDRDIHPSTYASW
ncbi:hypothetical protein BBJ28_00010716 [Nothophytophthora sp. Chile5]|nr:hypothetical protein BBJ28_00010716 [Nothophytophthora sp. Chile5]